jgi:ubiquitin C-terminal hydrolase
VNQHEFKPDPNRQKSREEEELEEALRLSLVPAPLPTAAGSSGSTAPNPNRRPIVPPRARKNARPAVESSEEAIVAAYPPPAVKTHKNVVVPVSAPAAKTPNNVVVAVSPPAVKTHKKVEVAVSPPAVKTHKQVEVAVSPPAVKTHKQVEVAVPPEKVVAVIPPPENFVATVPAVATSKKNVVSSTSSVASAAFNNDEDYCALLCLSYPETCPPSGSRCVFESESSSAPPVCATLFWKRSDHKGVYPFCYGAMTPCDQSNKVTCGEAQDWLLSVNQQTDAIVPAPAGSSGSAAPSPKWLDVVSSIRREWLSRPLPEKIPMNGRSDDDVNALQRMTFEEQMAFFQANADRLDAPVYDIDPRPGRRGFDNLGNTCYINALMQGLGHINSFRSYIHDRFVPRLRRHRGSVSASLIEFVRLIDEEMMSTSEFGIIQMNTFYDRLIAEYPKTIKRGLQADSMEVFGFMVDEMEKVDPEGIKELFEVPMYDIDQCPSCSTVRETNRHGFHVLFLPPLDTFREHTLADRIHDWGLTSPITVGEEKTCTACGNSENRRTHALRHGPGPQILVIQLMRDDFGRRPKVTYPQRLTFNGIRGEYRLVSTVNHGAGHYTSEFYDPIYEQWVKANDRVVSDIDHMEYTSTSVSVLVYERI